MRREEEGLMTAKKFENMAQMERVLKKVRGISCRMIVENSGILKTFGTLTVKTTIVNFNYFEISIGMGT